MKVVTYQHYYGVILSDDELEADGSITDLFTVVGRVITGNSDSEYSSKDTLPYETDSPSTKRKKTTTNKNTKKVNKKNDVPPGFDLNLWNEGDYPLSELPPFDDSTSGFHVDIPEDAEELYFFKLFVTDNLVEYMTYTNLTRNSFLKPTLNNFL